MAVVEEIDCRASGVAEQVHAVRQCAYAQEAALLGVEDFPPLRIGVRELGESGSRHFVVRRVGQIVAVLELGSEPGGLCINSLVVFPEEQGQGLGGALLRAAIAAAAGGPLEVQTGLRNERAISLYRKHGFKQVKVWRSADGLDLVRLRHHGHGNENAA